MKEFEQTFDILHEPSQEELVKAASVACGVPASKIRRCTVLRRSLDARGRPVYRYRLRAFLEGDEPEREYRFDYKDVRNAPEVIVIGGGPAGTFASLKLLEKGLKPVILERGKDVHSRKVDISAIVREGVVNADSNYCFGEGGAGTFSDGKLYTRSSKRGDIYEVLHQFVAFGAQPSILVDAHPHIGSDVLPRVMENIRGCITCHGGEYHFGAKVVDLVPPASASGKWKAVCADGSCFCASNVILATGHSARDIYELFASKGWELQAKGFALGVRVEHPQSLIDEIQYHKRWQAGYPHAEYSLVEQVDGRGVFSFCMCPGGVLVPSTTEGNAVVLNGMSPSTRSGKKANAGIVCSVEPEDVAGFEKYGPLALLEFQKSVEERMFSNSASLRAPAQRMTDFCRGKMSASLPACTYAPGTDSALLCGLLPDFVAARLRRAFPLFDRKMHGFYTGEALVLGVESRTSSPVRIPRDAETLCHTGHEGLYPCGEGAGYAGGIVSSALDGIAVACAIASK